MGQLYLQNGQWNGQQLVPEEWVHQATLRQTSNGSNPDSDWEQGYGYQFWRCQHNAYRGDGAFGQYCLVMPDQDAVVAITSGLKNMQNVLNLIWKHLLPAMQDTPLPSNSPASESLQEKLTQLSLPTSQGQSTSQIATEVSKQTYVLETNENQIQTIAFDFKNESPTISVTDANGNHQIACGYQTWIKGETAFVEEEMQAVAASGAWATDDTYVIKLYFYETPICATLTSKFDGDKVLFDYEFNVGFGDNQRPQLVGQKRKLE